MKFKKFLLNALPYVYLTLFIITTALILIKSAENGESSASSSNSFADYLQNNVAGFDKIAEKSSDFNTLVRKFFGHYGLFALNGFFAFLTYFSFTKTTVHAISLSGISTILIASISELIQGATAGRTLLLSDVILDIQGFISGVCIAIIFSNAHLKKRIETPYASNVSYALLLLLTLLIYLTYFVMVEKTESAIVCAITQLLVTIVYIIIEGIILIVKNKANSKNIY